MKEWQIDKQMEKFCGRLLPRMLTQVCRDPDSPAYGSFDRNWWHYKIRDFPSIILQQGGYALYCASELPVFADRREALRILAAASCRFWNQRARKFRAFEEYYPWEEGYPPVAFATLAVAKLAAVGVVAVDEIVQGLEIAARQLMSRFESEATNQQVAGTAALCWIRKIEPQLIDEVKFQEICSRTLACQHEEGWYLEYGGPDLGYLSVTMDCLWDAFEASGDERFRKSAAKALEFIAPFVALPQRGAGMHNARNTDYIVPYGIARFSKQCEYEATAAMILSRTLEQIDSPEHFTQAIDDRYYCHYIGHSFFRSVPLVEGLKGERVEGWNGVRVAGLMDGCGYYFHRNSGGRADALVSCKKGGIATFWLGEQAVADFGWAVRTGERSWVSHWWADFWKPVILESGIRITGALTPHRETESTPLKHLILRGVSLFLGRRIIGLLKEKLIFKNKQSAEYPFVREIQWVGDAVRVEDRLDMPPGGRLMRAPRSSKRHVASADSYHLEDLRTVAPGIAVEEIRKQNESQIEIVTVYRLKR